MVKNSVVLALILMVILVGVAFAAQEQPTGSFEDLSAELITALTVFAGLVGSMAAEAVKKVAWLKEEDRSSIGGWVAQLVTGVITIGAGYLVTLLAQGIGQVENPEVSRLVVIFGAWGVAELRYQLARFIRTRESKGVGR